MVQDFTEDPYDPDHVADTDLENMEDNFTTLKSSFSGPASPPNPIAGLDWFDTAKKVKKVRNAANDAWVGLMHADASHKIPVYRNNQPDGWLIDSDIFDCVIALKGGGQAYNTAAGAIAGTWQHPDHTLVEAEVPDHDHGAVGNHGHTIQVGTGSDGQGGIATGGQYSGTSPSGTSSAGGHTHPAFGGDGAHNHGLTQRVRAAMCTLQYLDL
jgi:hypothetical protein